MTRLRTSIVICTYNGAAYLRPQLDSLLAQTLLPDEVLIADDGSSDATLEILQLFVTRARDRGVEVVLRCNSQNLGYVKNFSQGLLQARGDIVFLCDQDDVWRADKLALMVARFVEDPSLLLHTDARLVDACGQPLHCSMFEALQLTALEKQAIHAGAAFDVFLRRSFVTGATAAARSDLLSLALPVVAGWIHDEWLAAVAAAVGQVDFIDEPLIDYRQHGANQIGARRRTLLMKWHDLWVPRGESFSEEAVRLRLLEGFLEQGGFPRGRERAEQVRHKRLHFQQRIAIGRMKKWQRLPFVLREALQGSYRRYGTGGRSMLRDLLRHD